MLRVHYAVPNQQQEPPVPPPGDTHNKIHVQHDTDVPHTLTTPRHTRRRNGTQGYGGHSVGETPGPIPNPEAKTHSADGTAPERVWESRTPPDNHYNRGPTTVGPLLR